MANGVVAVGHVTSTSGESPPCRPPPPPKLRTPFSASPTRLTIDKVDLWIFAHVTWMDLLPLIYSATHSVGGNGEVQSKTEWLSQCEW